MQENGRYRRMEDAGISRTPENGDIGHWGYRRIWDTGEMRIQEK